MALDVCIGNTFEEAVESDRCIGISPQAHASIMLHVSRGQTPMLMRLGDYLAVAVIERDEVIHLRDEALHLQASFKPHQLAYPCIVGLIDICNLAMERKCGLYALCD